MSTSNPDNYRDRLLARGSRYDVTMGESMADAHIVAHFTNMLAKAEGLPEYTDAESIRSAWANKRMISLIIHDTHALSRVGSLNISLVYNPAKPEARKVFVYDFHIPEHTFGAGAAALRKVEAIAKLLDIKEVEFVVTNGGSANERIYKMMGAREVGRVYTVKI